MKDLRLMLDYVAKNSQSYSTTYGNVSAASIGAIQRSLLTLAEQGGDKFFGEPAFDIYDLLQTEGGRGVMNILAADKLMLQPKLYSTFLMWLLSEIYDKMPETGDMELPKMVFFFDEAHMLFKDTSKALTDKIEQIVRLIRSKGIGIYFISQSPSDLPEAILGQCGNRVQHALRAFTPKDQAAVKAAAQTFRTNRSDIEVDFIFYVFVTGFANSFVQCSRIHRIDGIFIKHAGAKNLFDIGTRGFTFAETRDVHFTNVFFVSSSNCFFEFGSADFDFQLYTVGFDFVC
jgi:DNA helicase HerA-like ATPase